VIVEDLMWGNMKMAYTSVELQLTIHLTTTFFRELIFEVIYVHLTSTLRDFVWLESPATSN
jgi:hypothetical protein